MQTISWEDEFRLMDGIPYDLDFFQDFQSMFGNEEPALIVDAKIAKKSVDAYVSSEARQYTLELFEQADKYVKQERKREEKWERKQKRDGRSKKEKMRDAMRYLDSITSN